MARRKDAMIEEIRLIRRGIARRLDEARRKGRFLEELRRLGREGRAFFKIGGSRSRR